MTPHSSLATTLVRAVKATGAGARQRSRQLRDPFASFYGAGQAIQPPLSPERLLALTEENPIHASCISAKTEDVIGRGWRVLVDGDPLDGQQDLDLRQRLEDLTPEYTFQELLDQAMWEQEAVGWAAWEVCRDEAGRLAAFYPLPAHTLRATIDPDVYVQLREGQTRWFKRFGSRRALNATTGKDAAPRADPESLASELIVFRQYAARSAFYGVPRWVAVIPALAEMGAIREFNLSVFASGGHVDKIVHVKADDVATASELAQGIQQELEEARGRGHVTVVTHGSIDVDVVVTQLSPTTGQRDGQYLRRREDLVREVLIGHRVPPYRIGWAELGGLGGSAAREMLRTYVSRVVRPRQHFLEDRLNGTLFGPAGLDLSGRWMLDDLTAEDLELDLDRAIQGSQLGLLSPNEGRQILGKKPLPLPGLDDYYLYGHKLAQLTAKSHGHRPAIPDASPVLESAAKNLPHEQPQVIRSETKHAPHGNYHAGRIPPPRSGRAPRVRRDGAANTRPGVAKDDPTPYQVLKRDAPRRYTLGVAYPANAVDAHGQFMDPQDLEETAWRYLQERRGVGLMHLDQTGGSGVPVESYIYRGPDWHIAGQVIKNGDWLLGVIWSEPAWDQIERGELTGYSMQGWGTQEAPE